MTWKRKGREKRRREATGSTYHFLTAFSSKTDVPSIRGRIICLAPEGRPCGAPSACSRCSPLLFDRAHARLFSRRRILCSSGTSVSEPEAVREFDNSLIQQEDLGAFLLGAGRTTPPNSPCFFD